MDYVDKLPPSPWYIFAPPPRYIFPPPLTVRMMRMRRSSNSLSDMCHHPHLRSGAQLGLAKLGSKDLKLGIYLAVQTRTSFPDMIREQWPVDIAEV